MVGAEPIFIDKNSNIGILMLHGFTSTPHQFKELSQFFASKGFTVYAPLVVGHGTSPKDLAKVGKEDWKKSVKDAYLELGKKVQKIFIIGNSFGGNLAFYLACEFQDNHLAGIISLDTPIRLRNQKIIKLRLYTYGWLRKYYRKPQRYYKIDYTDMSDEVTYSVVPVKSLRDFFEFIEEETVPNLNKIKAPTLIAHANVDPVVDPKSATFIHDRLGSNHKIIYWFDSNQHSIVFLGKKRYQLFEKIYEFIKSLS